MIYHWSMETPHEILELIPWDGPAIALLDLDAFFASVEQRDHPEWRGKPVIVGGKSGNRGVVAAASYEARVFGVHSAMPSAEAERRCPDAIWTRGRHEHYREVSDGIMDIIRDETPYIQQVSIDEAFFDISPGTYTGDHPVAIVRRIQNRVRELGITCSIGLSTSKTVSKIASDLDKPDGLTIIFPGSEESFLAPRDIADLSGIGPKAVRRLRSVGIETLGDLASADIETLKPHLGSASERFRLRARGAEYSPIVMDEPVKSISNERTFTTDLTDEDDVTSAVYYLGEKVAGRLRAHGLVAHTLVLRVRFDFATTRSAQLQVPGGFDDLETMRPRLRELLDRLWTPPTPIRLIGVGAKDFDERDEQLDLFDPLEAPVERPKRPRTAEALDSIRARFGSDKLIMGSELVSREHLGDTIAMDPERQPRRNPDDEEPDS